MVQGKLLYLLSLQRFILLRRAMYYSMVFRFTKTYQLIAVLSDSVPSGQIYLSVRDNLLFAGRYLLMSAELIQQRMAELMTYFGLTKYAHFRVDALSGGYKQRLSIARALMHNPAIVILDEPTVGLDPSIRRQLWEIIKQLKRAGITVILTTHYLDEAEELSDRVCVLHKGKIILTETLSILKERHKQDSLEDIFLRLTELECEVE
jgi:ABC-2 type transport system ATP-binding protein